MPEQAPLSTTDLRQRLRALPKVELHRHLEASARLETLWELHQANGETLHVSLDTFRAAVVVPEGAAPGFLPFLARFNALRFHYGGAAELERIAGEAVADAAADGVAHLELRFSPVFWARRMLKAPPASLRGPGPQTGEFGRADPPPSLELAEAAAEAIVRGARGEASRRGLSLAFIFSLGRSFGMEVNRCTFGLLDRPVGQAIAAVDVAGDEAFPLRDLEELLSTCRARNLPLTLHAGEDSAGPGAAGVREAVEVCGAVRIGHGLRAVEDPATLGLLARRRVPLELCLTSNIQTRAAASFAAHPLSKLQRAGVRVTLNTDDPLLSGITLSEEYARAHERCGLTWTELRALAVAGAEAAFLPEPARAALARRVGEAWDPISRNG